ncbi:unnamed protein product [Brachionus calyciflorus]|uniref:Uncharacterized protein n=1 Tax=Brachionus calyciflorus TaxID=104777 RepID=A0A814ESL9_9BILA|nr:unnamed protein product [Brachionus calyciflorus]
MTDNQQTLISLRGIVSDLKTYKREGVTYRFKCYDLSLQFNIVVDIKNPQNIIEDKTIYDFKYFLLIKRNGLEVINCVFSEIEFVKKHNYSISNPQSHCLSQTNINFTNVEKITDIQNQEFVTISCKLMDVNLKNSNISVKLTDICGQNIYGYIFDIEKSEPAIKAETPEDLQKKLIEFLGKDLKFNMCVKQKKIKPDQIKIYYTILSINE